MTHSADRISDLSDDLLRRILFFLPTKLAFTTTLLSKRWAPLCYSLTVLHFDDETVKDSNSFHRFCRFVDTFMHSPRVSNQSLKTFSLKCHFFNRQRFDAWVEAAKRRRVEEFHLSMLYQTVTPIILNSETLVVLKLERLKFASDSLCVDLPLLKTLNLKFVYFKYQKDFTKLLCACPILEDLYVEPIYMEFDEKNSPVGFNSMTLSNLVRAEIDSMDVEFPSINKQSGVSKLPIKVKNQDSLTSYLVLRNLIQIELFFGDGSNHCWDGVLELLHHCPKLQILFIRKSKTSLSKDWKCPILNLECLSSHLKSCTVLNFKGSANDLQFATYILQNARGLQDMTIGVSTSSSNGTLLEKSQIIEELSSYPRISRKCKLSFKYK